MADLDYEIFVNMVFPPHDRWAEEGIDPKGLSGLNEADRARAEALLLSVLPTSLDWRPFKAAGLLGLASAAPLLRQRVTDYAGDLRHAAQSTVIAAAGALRRLGETAVAEEALLRAVRLMASAPFNEANPIFGGPWGGLMGELKEWPPSAPLLATLLALVADESLPARVDAEFANLARPDPSADNQPPNVPYWVVDELRREAAQRSPALRAGHLPTVDVALERILNPDGRYRLVAVLEELCATDAGRAALAAIDPTERASLEAWLGHRLVAHEDRHAVLFLGFLGSRAALPALEEAMQRWAGQYDAARAAVARHLIDGFDALPTVEQVIHNGRQADYPGHIGSHRAQAVRLLAYLPLGRPDVERLLLGILDNDDVYAAYVLLDWVERLATTDKARRQLSVVQVARRNREDIKDGRWPAYLPPPQPLTVDMLSELAELLDV